MKVHQAAIVDVDGNIHTLPKPARHHHILRKMYADGVESLITGQGFVLEDGTFVGRKEAADIALREGQTEYVKSYPSLTSEDLW
jgi:hypothetical protein